MYRASSTNFQNLTSAAARQWLQSFDTVLTDCDGVLWHDDTPIAGSPEVIAALQRHGKRVHFVTNNSTKTRHDIWKRALAQGYHVAEEAIVAPTHSIVEYLQQRNFCQTAYVIGGAALGEELTKAGINFVGGAIADVLDIKMGDYIERELMGQQQHGTVGAVIVGFDEHFSYGKMMKACNFLSANEECVFLATNTDAVHRYPAYCIPGTGAILRAVETCAGRKAIVLGKPNPVVCETLLRQGLLQPERTLMVGDCAKIDVTFGKNCGFQTLLVGTGSYKFQDVLKMRENIIENQKYIPDMYADKFGDLLQFL